MCVCTYVYIYICVYININTCIYIYMHVVNICVYIYTRMVTDTCCGLFEVFGAIAGFRTWDHGLGKYCGSYSSCNQPARVSAK